MKEIIAATIGVFALSSGGAALAKSSASQREYKRGYADCLAGRWDENQHGASYKEGCRAAEDKKNAGGAAGGAATSDAARSEQPHGKAKISDLKGKDSIKVFDVMTSRGFKNVDTINSESTVYGIYFNPATGQCVQLTNADNRVTDARDIGTHPNCK